jgi:hypothetical protein
MCDTSRGQGHVKWSAALAAESLSNNKLGLSCTLCMRIHPIVRPPLSLAWTYVHPVHTRRVRRCGWVYVTFEQLSLVGWRWVLKRSLYWRYR